MYNYIGKQFFFVEKQEKYQYCFYWKMHIYSHVIKANFTSLYS